MNVFAVNKFLRFFIVSLVCLSLFACQTMLSPSMPESAQATPVVADVTKPVSTVTPTSYNDTPAPSPTATSYATPTPDLRLPPEDWREWPVIPTLSPRARDIYLQGQALGNDPRHFSKVGDCQSVPASFFGIYDMPGRYSFAPKFEYLQQTVDYYAGSFGREGQSVRGGFNAASVLLPMWADPKACESGETPIECENRIHNPSIVIISLEVWFKGRTPETYERYLRQVVEYFISQGVLPILATKADNVEQDHSINYTVAKLAYEYDIPMWNFWRAVQPLKDHGIDWARDPDGFHITVEGWNMRSFTALQVLDSIRRELAGESVPQPGLAPQTTPTPTPIPQFTAHPLAGLPYAEVEFTPAPGSPAPAILFGLSSHGIGTAEKLGIFQGDLRGQAWLAIVEQGFELLDYSSNGILARQDNQLYLLNGAEVILLSDKLTSTVKQPAIWLADGRIAAVLDEKLSIISKQGVEEANLSQAGEKLLEIYPSQDTSRLYALVAVCNGEDCSNQQFTTYALNAIDAQILAGSGFPAFFATNRYAYAVTGKATTDIMLVVDGRAIKIQAQGNRIMDMSWSPDGSLLAVSISEVSSYSGRALKSRLYLITPDGNFHEVLLPETGITEDHAWALDGKSLLLVRRQYRQADYLVTFSQVDITKKIISNLEGLGIASEKYLVPSPLFIIPDAQTK